MITRRRTQCKINYNLDNIAFRVKDINDSLTSRQKQLLYECEEERMVIKACLRELITKKRQIKHTSWDTAEAANMCLD